MSLKDVVDVVVVVVVVVVLFLEGTLYRVYWAFCVLRSSTKFLKRTWLECRMN